MKRVITRESCFESSRSENEKIIDKKRISFMVRSKIRGIYGNKWLGSIWLILDPVATALVYLLVLTVVRSNPSPESLFIGVSLFRIFQTSFKSGVNSVSDFTGGIKVERVRTLVVVTSMIRYRLLDSFLASFGVGLILLLYLEMHFEGVLAFLILGQTLGIVSEGFGLNLTLVVKKNSRCWLLSNILPDANVLWLSSTLPDVRDEWPSLQNKPIQPLLIFSLKHLDLPLI